MATLALAGGLVAAAAALRGYCPPIIADHYRRQLATVSDAEAGRLLSRAARLEAAGIPVLVEAMGSPRKAVAAAGRQTLLDEFSRWELLRARDSSPRLEILAAALAERAEGFPPAARQEAAHLATQILLWPLDKSKADRVRVLACCEKVLRACGGRPDAPGATDADRADLAAGDSRAAVGASVQELDDHRHEGNPQATGILLPGVPAIPGGGLADRLDPAADPDFAAGGLELGAATGASPKSQPEAPAVPVPAEGPRLLQPLQLLAELENVKSRVRPRTSLAAERQDNAESLRPLGYGSSAAAPAASAPESVPVTSRLSWAETVDLLRQLSSGDSAAAGDAQIKLSAAGFTAVHFEIARQMFDPDAAVRVALARRLPALGSIDPMPWLEHLSRDASAEVRLAAMGILATTGDRALLSRIEQAARRDPDPAIQRLAGQIAARRGGSLR